LAAGSASAGARARAALADTAGVSNVEGTSMGSVFGVLAALAVAGDSAA
jgi:hypothetical protein